MARGRAGSLAGDGRGGRAARDVAGGGHASPGSDPRRRDGQVLRHAGDRDLLDDAPRTGSRGGVHPLPDARRRPRVHRSPSSLQGYPSDMTPEETAAAIARHVSDPKALEIVQLDLPGLIDYTTYFVICPGRTTLTPKAT